MKISISSPNKRLAGLSLESDCGSTWEGTAAQYEAVCEHLPVCVCTILAGGQDTPPNLKSTKIVSQPIEYREEYHKCPR